MIHWMRVVFFCLLTFLTWGVWVMKCNAADKNLADEMAVAHNLVEKDLTNLDHWKEGLIDGYKVAVSDVLGDIHIFVGGPEDAFWQMPLVGLRNMSSAGGVEGSQFPVRDVPGLSDSPLASNFVLEGPVDTYQVAVLRIPEIYEGLPKFESALSSIRIFETPSLVAYFYRNGTTRQTLDADLKRLLAIADALRNRKGQ